nr:DUF4245 family protein [Curtobacterium sp. Csp1]
MTDAETWARKDAARRTRREHQTAFNLVLALIASLGIVLFLVLVVVRPDQTVDRTVDYQQIASQANVPGVTLAAPDLPKDYSANRADFQDKTSDGVKVWTVGLITPDKQYIGLQQGIDANAPHHRGHEVDRVRPASRGQERGQPRVLAGRYLRPEHHRPVRHRRRRVLHDRRRGRVEAVHAAVTHPTQPDPTPRKPMPDRAAATPSEALRLLVEGNARFAADKRRTGRIDPDRRGELTGSQAPFATVLGCSDSRVPFEHVFDAGIGDLFAIRNAGQIVDDVVLGSIEFAVVALGTPLVVVLRHTRCGAVAAARSGEPVPAPHLQALVDAIAPSVEQVRTTDADLPQEAVGAAHLEATLRQVIERSGAVSDAIAEGRLAVVGATYDLGTGEVSIDTVVGQA